jgi:hypothetical protein
VRAPGRAPGPAGRCRAAGMVPGLGRGAPGTPPGRGAAGRSDAGVPNGLLPGRGAGLPIPVLPPNGLFPGLGPAGFGVAGFGVAGVALELGVGRGAGVGAADGTGVAGGAGVVALAVVASGGAGTAFMEGAVVLALPSESRFSEEDSWVAAAFLVVFLAAFLAGFGSAGGIASLSRRATGASIVDDAERTNSPMSCNLARTVLLS